MLKKLIRNLLKKAGFILVNYDSYFLGRRLKIIKHHDIDILFDIGANIGQYAQKMRELGYSKKIVSFEPMQDAFNVLKNASKNDSNWEVRHYALGSSNGTSEINVAGNSISSSILKMQDTHVKSSPNSSTLRTEEIEIKKLEDVLNNFHKEGDKTMLKIDTQGFEKEVLLGANAILPKCSLVQMELSFVELYKGQDLFEEMINYMKTKNFRLISLESGFSNPKTGELLQIDAIFENIKLR